MDADKVKRFLELAGYRMPDGICEGDPELRELGAHLLLSEVLEYVVYGLGIEPEVDGVRIQDPKKVKYHKSSRSPDKREMLDGLADVAYTMYWNSSVFGLPLEEAFEVVCDNNLEKFVRLEQWQGQEGHLAADQWHCGMGIAWPQNVVSVEIRRIDYIYYAVGKDQRGKVRKPSTYAPVDLTCLLS